MMSALKYDKLTSKTFVKDEEGRGVKKLQVKTVKDELLKTFPATGV